MYPVFMAGTTGIGTNDNTKRTNTEENMIRDWGREWRRGSMIIVPRFDTS